MSEITLAEFLGFASQDNVFAYNQKLVEMIFDGMDHIFEGAVVLDAGAGAHFKHFSGRGMLVLVIYGKVIIVITYPPLSLLGHSTPVGIHKHFPIFPCPIVQL